MSRSSRPLHVAIVAPPWFELPPTGYGGIEAMCSGLIEGLINSGVRVSLLGVGHNGTSADFVRLSPSPQYARMGEVLPEVVHAGQLVSAIAELNVDVVHDHSVIGPLLSRAHRLPTIVTAHGPIDGDMATYYRQLQHEVSLVAISEAQQVRAPDIAWAGMVHNAVPVNDFPFIADKDEFALFLGRMTPEKGLPAAIDAAQAAGIPLVIAAKLGEPAEHEYFNRVIKPRLGPGVTWIGEVGGDRKLALLAAARCLLFPVRWEEPFGMVMIEALACGTPVVALRRGAVAEVVIDGVTGLICDTPAELPNALHRVRGIDPVRCRRDALERFDQSTMAARYLSIYRAASRQRVTSPVERFAASGLSD